MHSPLIVAFLPSSKLNQLLGSAYKLWILILAFNIYLNCLIIPLMKGVISQTLGSLALGGSFMLVCFADHISH